MEDLLIRIGINPALYGFRYLCALCAHYAADDSAAMMTRYNAVAQSFNTSASCVERCCRHAIERMTDEIRPEIYTRYLLREPSIESGTYEVSTFIALAAAAYFRENHPY